MKFYRELVCPVFDEREHLERDGFRTNHKMVTSLSPMTNFSVIDIEIESIGNLDPIIASPDVIPLQFTSTDSETVDALETEPSR